jgi:arylsulfatase A-like enzyme
VTKVELWTRAFALPELPLERTTDEVTVPAGAVLLGSFGLDPVSRDVARRPVAFRVAALSGDERRVLLDEVLDPAAPESFRWTDFRLDLDALAGRTVRLALEASLVPDADEGASTIAMPAWSVPRILAPPAGEPAPVRNVILVSLDTLRADYVGAYGQELPTTPRIDRFAAEGVLFENAYTTYPSTTASHMSMFTGLYPEVHGAYGPTHRVPQAIPLLAELLRARGYVTGAVTEDAMLAAVIGFPRGFDSYREFKSPESRTEGHAKEVVDSGLAWLEENRGGRFFLFLHTYQVHGPYDPPAGYDVFTAQPADLPQAHADARRGYAGDLLYADEQVGRLLAGLAELGEAERTIVVITADHGEELGEHGVIGHSWYMNDASLRVPLLIRAPGAIPPGTRVRASASLADITPTLLELIGGASGTPPPVFQGASLVPLLRDPDASGLRDRVVFTEKLEKGVLSVAAHRERRKWKRGGGASEAPQHFDLASDPLERTPRSDPAEVAEGVALLDGYRASNAATRKALGRPAQNEAVQVDGDTQHKLRALGYVE